MKKIMKIQKIKAFLINIAMILREIQKDSSKMWRLIHLKIRLKIKIIRIKNYTLAIAERLKINKIKDKKLCNSVYEDDEFNKKLKIFLFRFYQNNKIVEIPMRKISKGIYEYGCQKIFVFLEKNVFKGNEFG